MKSNNILITVFTPTYNRAHLLSRIYDSLKSQKYKNFEWIIVDDGSNDNTKNVVNSFIKENKINIKYIYQKNSGKHVAINTGVKTASGDFFIIVDSDDYLVSDALYTIKKNIESIPELFAGIGGQKAYSNKKLIGSTFFGEYIDCTSLERRKYKILGDKAEVFRTSILKKYPFPKIEGEKFLAEAYIWNKIAADGYKIRWINKPLIICEYIADGISNNQNSIVSRSPKGQMLYLEDLIKYENSRIHKIAHYATYIKLARTYYNKEEICNKLNINIIQYYSFLIIAYLRGGLHV